MKTIIALLLCSVSLCRVSVAAEAPDANTFIRDFYGAYKAKDSERLAQFYAPDATFVDPTFELNLKGPDQIRDLLQKALAKYETLDFEITHTISAGDDLVVEGVMAGKLSQNAVRVPFVSVFHFNGEKIAAQRDMFDVLHFFKQLGMHMTKDKE
jgi:limonene-1,2-epoxide hydrolase